MSPNNLVAAIDMGTNTFHMLIAYVENHTLHEVFRLRKWVNLAEAGLEHIGEASIMRARAALREFQTHINKYEVGTVKAVATEAFRSAENGMQFLQEVKDELNIHSEIISGDKEAELIYKGISLLKPGKKDEYTLIMDIGGGSTEFILYNRQGKEWSRSYKAGVTFLFNLYVDTDPLNDQQEVELITYFNDQFPELIEKCKQFHVTELVGASGSFEVVEMMMGISPSRSMVTCVEVENFLNQFEYIRNTTLIERFEDPRIPANRAKLIVVAYILMKYIIDHVQPEQICVSPYAMKEGIIKESLENLDKSKKII